MSKSPEKGEAELLLETMRAQMQSRRRLRELQGLSRPMTTSVKRPGSCCALSARLRPRLDSFDLKRRKFA